MLLSRAVKFLRCRVHTVALQVWAVLGVSFLFVGPAHAATYAVKADGSGDFTTIQACAEGARAGDTCMVYAGIYNEHVKTTAGGSGDSARITFKAQGVARMQGFDIQHPYVTVDGFDITGFTGQYAGLITITGNGDNCRIVNNTLRDGLLNVYGLYFSTSGPAASACVVQGNRLDNLLGPFLTTNGDHHLFERNTFERQNSRDYIRLFGTDHVFRRNVFWKGTTMADTGNHPDFVQTFGISNMPSENHIFEENWIQDLPSQFGQLNSGQAVPKTVLYDNVRNITFRRNVIAGVSNNANIVMPGVRFEHNTFYRFAYTQAGIGFGGALTRGFAANGRVTNNVFLAGGFRASVPEDAAGFYAVSGQVMSQEVIGVFVTNDRAAQLAVTKGIHADLVAQGYIDTNGRILAKAAALLKPGAVFALSAQYATYTSAVHEKLLETAQMDAVLRTTFLADFNYVAGAAAAGFPAKRTRDCPAVRVTTATASNFCEPHGINGGDPRLVNPDNPLGPDGIPFTLDDGLKPLPTSPLCGKGAGGTDIGTYSCDPTKVFADGGPELVPPPPPPTVLPPRPPTHPRILR